MEGITSIHHEFAVCDDRYLAILGQSNDIHGHAARAEERKLALRRLGKKNLRDGVATGEVDQRFRGVRAFEHSRFDMQFARELQMLFERDRIGRRHHADGETIGLQIIGDAPAAAD